SCIPRKFMPTSTYSIWVADQKYARAAQFLGLVDDNPPKLPADITPEEQEKLRRERMNLLLRRAVFDLAKTCGQPMSISELGISEEDF
ncbi:hypothetical protein ABTE87_20545, partial [Acinetobacter baumannii]